MTDKKIRIKVSELRTLVREALNTAGRQNMMAQGDDSDVDLHDGKGKEQLTDVDLDGKEQLNDVELDEKAPPGWEGTVKAMKKNKDIENPWALAWSMKNKGEKSHKKESVEPVVEFRSYDDDFAEKITDRKYEAMAKQLYLAWSERGVDVDWGGVVNLYARNHSKNLATEIDKTKLYEKVLNFVEQHLNSDPLSKAKGKS